MLATRELHWCIRSQSFAFSMTVVQESHCWSEFVAFELTLALALGENLKLWCRNCDHDHDQGSRLVVTGAEEQHHEAIVVRMKNFRRRFQVGRELPPWTG